MAEFENIGLKAGVWSGLLHRSTAPDVIGLIHQGERVAEARVAPVKDGVWRIDAEVPAGLLNDGTVSLLLVEMPADATRPGNQLGNLAIVAGAPLELDLLAELDLLRAELDFLKREFRRLAAG